jgi:hypothetical protein
MTLLDVANYGLFNDAEHFLAIAAKVLLGGLGIAFGGIFLFTLFIASLIGITVFSVVRGLRYRSFPRMVGTFFRLAGIILAAFAAFFILPIIGLLFSISFLKLLIAFTVLVSIGYLVGRTVSKMIGVRGMLRISIWLMVSIATLSALYAHCNCEVGLNTLNLQ